MSINGKHRPLTIEREAEIREELETAPVAIAGWYDSPRDKCQATRKLTHPTTRILTPLVREPVGCLERRP